MMITVPCRIKLTHFINILKRPFNIIETYAQRNATTESHISAHGQVIQLNDVRDVGKATQELLHLREVVLSQLDERRGREHSLWRHYQAAVLKRI